jgi:two-component system sensor histidine kinase UhpB
LLPDGSIGWQQWVNHAIFGSDGQLIEFQGIGRDITDRRRAEDALRRNEAALHTSYAQVKDLAGRLIAAQEAERTRIARDLHDDINQQLAGISITLGGVRRKLSASAPEIREDLVQVQQSMMDLAESIRKMSHELHPGVLQHVGLAAALRSFCAKLGSKHGIELSLQLANNLGAIPFDVSLCLYRVVQEALHNAARHANARRVRVSLSRGANSLELSVTDDGQGFDLTEAHQGGGLGLISLEERIRLVGGTMKIDTRPQWGTELRVRVPIEEMQHEPSERADCR